VIWFNPNLRTYGLLLSATYLPSAFYLAYSNNLALFSTLDSGEYFLNNLNNPLAWSLSTVLEN